MKFSIKKEIILNQLLHVSKALSNKNFIPILAGIKFELIESGLLLTGSDNEITIQAFIDSEKFNIIKLGSIVIPGKYIVEIIKKLPDEIINIEIVDGLKLLVSTQRTEFNLNGISAMEYPKINIEKNKKPIIISKNIFKNIINQTSFAFSLQETRPVLTGINFKLNKNTMECTATDSYRLAKKIISIENNDELFDIVIPGKNLIDLNKIIDDNDEKLEIHIFNNKIIFIFENITFQSKLINGSYPDTTKFIENINILKVYTNTLEFYDVIDRASLLTNDKEKNIVNLEIKDNILILTSNSPEIGKVEERMEIEKNNKVDLKISFSAKYMMEAIKAFESEKIEIIFNEETKPIILKNPYSDDLMQLVLPIRTY